MDLALRGCVMQDIVHHEQQPINNQAASLSPFQRFATSVRKSFNRIRKSGRRKSQKLEGREHDVDDGEEAVRRKNESNVSETDDEIVARKDAKISRDGAASADDCESVDSGLDTDHSSDLNPSANVGDYGHGKSSLRKENGYFAGGCSAADWLHPAASSSRSSACYHSSNRSSSYYPDSILSTNTTLSSSNIDRKSSGRSNHTIDSGILVNNKRSPPNRNLRYEEILPKKRVSILLPEKGVQHARIVRRPDTHNDYFVGDRPSASPVLETDLITEAMHELMSVNSQHCDIIFLMFVPRPNLKALSADEVGRILYGIYSILRGDTMRHLHFFEISVWMLQRFMFKVSRLLETRPGLAHQPVAWESLIRKSELMKYSRDSPILEETRTLYLELWFSLLGVGI